jgi:mRNA export factor
MKSKTALYAAQVDQPPEDTIQALRFSTGTQQLQLIACGSWDNQVRVYEVRADGSTQGRAGQTLQAPVLDLSWNQVLIPDYS